MSLLYTPCLPPPWLGQNWGFLTPTRIPPADPFCLVRIGEVSVNVPFKSQGLTGSGESAGCAGAPELGAGTTARLTASRTERKAGHA